MQVNKTELRRIFRARRNAVSGEEREAAQHAIVENIARVLAQEKFHSIATYLAVRGEANIDELLRVIARCENVFAAPANIYSPPTFKTLESAEEIVIEKSGARLPLETAPAVPAVKFDVFLVPAIAFDVFGNRLGQGAGWYDRILSQAPHALKVGVAFECQIAEQLPSESHDVPMNFVVTESRIIEAQVARRKLE